MLDTPTNDDQAVSFLFVYGSLRPSDDLKSATAKGKLYDVSWYPGAKFDIASSSLIRGNIIDVSHKELCSYDCYEGYDSLNPDSPNNLFRRVKVEAVLLGSGKTVECWAYEYNQPVSPETLIPSGEWKPCP